MDSALHKFVRERSALHCEYCRMPQSLSDAVHEMDHVIAEKHRGTTTVENLALACFHCNNHKGPNIAGIDPDTGQVTRLFHPRRDRWCDHFVWQGPLLLGLTAIGRVTVEVLNINLHHRILHRHALLEEGVFPPSHPSPRPADDT